MKNLVLILYDKIIYINFNSKYIILFYYIMNNNIDNEDIDFFNINSIINYISINYTQFLLLFLVFIIIFIVDYVSNLNNMIYGATQVIPGINSSVKIPEIKKTNKKTKKIK